MNTEIKEKTNRISKSIFEFSENQEDWIEAFNEFVFVQPKKLNHVPVHGDYNCVCGAKIRHGRSYINKHNKNQIWIGKRCQTYLIENDNKVLDEDNNKSNKNNSNVDVEHIKKCIVENEDFGDNFTCHYCYWILPKTHKQKGFSHKCTFCHLKCKFCEGQKTEGEGWKEKCSNCYFKEKGYKKCSICNNFKLKPDTTYTKCYDCVKKDKRVCCKCGKYKVKATSKYFFCYDCNAILKGLKGEFKYFKK
jgi:hypothetical protein